VRESFDRDALLLGLGTQLGQFVFGELDRDSRHAISVEQSIL
jgi:hypothetical protein